jgi:hypothetical protein
MIIDMDPPFPPLDLIVRVLRGGLSRNTNSIFTSDSKAGSSKLHLKSYFLIIFDCFGCKREATSSYIKSVDWKVQTDWKVLVLFFHWKVLRLHSKLFIS